VQIENRKYVAKSLRLKDVYYDDVLRRKKISTIRFGQVLFNDVLIELTFESKPALKINIQKIDYSKTFASISEGDAINDGYDSLLNLKNDLKKYYPNIQDNSPITIIYFQLIDQSFFSSELYTFEKTTDKSTFKT